jgi:hypothetical protein
VIRSTPGTMKEVDRKTKHIGLDAHKKETRLCWIDGETGEIAGQFTIPTPDLVATVGSLAGGKRVALETGSHSWFLGWKLESLPHTAVVACRRLTHWISDSLTAAVHLALGGPVLTPLSLLGYLWECRPPAFLAESSCGTGTPGDRL